mmetsp:Transcript_19705/g.19805  ORF Transcript_19705/g.19805 Transcript_19705/m.19805 type:complete len:241 (-) Transcript_19705:66-788(-)|eukprot:CAMPEP_0182423636 /NCGR_PEP_ID=MMETSP1167-20130531/9714_1 /TAXON_ID=2988 /ORGANISM="Mallomonas Sp, Strain CCMP3275" /LENGTH=240 /DNA_ID=CAMNT_0024602807 /DNA_START=94 /DNA_END=816 /DNA_ORIENTATION=-
MYNIALCLTLLMAVSLHLCNCAGDFHHQVPDQHKYMPGWQEPGLWRPKWIMDRYFDEKDGVPAHRDRICFRLKSDRTMKFYQSQKRPFLEITKADAQRNSDSKKKKLFETSMDGEDSNAPPPPKLTTYLDHEPQDIEGSWHWQPAIPLPNQAKVKLETEETFEETNESIKREKIRHDIRCEWGKLDGYAAKFTRGKILKYRSAKGPSKAGVPMGMYQAGTFTIRVSPHRPMIAKDFLAFQ